MDTKVNTEDLKRLWEERDALAADRAELLAACKAALAWIDEQGSLARSTNAARAVVRGMEAAIAKAGGREG